LRGKVPYRRTRCKSYCIFGSAQQKNAPGRPEGVRRETRSANIRGIILDPEGVLLEHWKRFVRQWQKPSTPPALGPEEAHVWMVRTDPDAVDVAPWMHALESDERERADRFSHLAGRTGYVVARSALRRLLSLYLGLPVNAVMLRRTATGKPQLADVHDPVVHFSVAHSGGIALLSFARVDVGVDVERIRPVPRADRIVSRVFSESMRQRLAEIPPDEWLPAFFAAWTQREALVKAIGGVLMATRDPLEFEWPATEKPRVFTVGTGRTRRWTVARLPQPAGYSAALVAAGDVPRMRLFTHPEEPFGSGDG
jgi:4'-phosphopantetheinyl transferase